MFCIRDRNSGLFGLGRPCLSTVLGRDIEEREFMCWLQGRVLCHGKSKHALHCKFESCMYTVFHRDIQTYQHGVYNMYCNLSCNADRKNSLHCKFESCVFDVYDGNVQIFGKSV